MKYAAGVLAFLLVPRAGFPVGPPDNGQEWLADPVLPSLFRGAAGSDEALPFAVPRLQEPGEAESPFPRGITGLDIQRWQAEDEMRRVREWVSDGTLGLPMLVPQLLLEAILPRGLAVGPTTMLYRTSPASASLALVVFDQVLFHEAEFLAQLQGRATDDALPPDALSSGQRRVFRKAFVGGLRATYAMPSLTMDLVFQTAEEQGVVGYVLAPPVAGALLYLKGIDQKVRLHDDLKIRFKVAPGRDWVRGVRADDGSPVLSFEVRFCELPFGVIGSFDLSSRGLTSEFIGLGTSLDALEELLGTEEFDRQPR